MLAPPAGARAMVRSATLPALEAVSDAYADARIEAAAQSRLDERAFPARCPYSWQQIMDRAVDWPPNA